MAVADQALSSIEGETIRSMDPLSEALGWNSAAIFAAGVHRNDDRVVENKRTEVFVMADPWPEYKLFSFEDGEFMHASDILSGEIYGTLEQHLEDYGSAEVVALSALDCIERAPQRTPTFVGGGDSGE